MKEQPGVPTLGVTLARILDDLVRTKKTDDEAGDELKVSRVRVRSRGSLHVMYFETRFASEQIVSFAEADLYDLKLPFSRLRTSNEIGLDALYHVAEVLRGSVIPHELRGRMVVHPPYDRKEAVE
jgi:hypothetical protein